MFNGTPKKLIIVGDKDTDVYCEYLSMLISVIDDITDENTDENKVVGIVDGSVDTAIWTNDIYRDNRAHTSSRQKFVFIGEKGSAKNIIPNINFEQSGTEQNDDLKEDISLGIYYGWFGNKACIYIDDTLDENHELYRTTFRGKYEKLFEQYKEKIAGAAQHKHSHKKKVLLGAATLVFTPFSLPLVLGTVGASIAAKEYKDNKLNKHEIMDQAYRYAILKFYLEYLELFME